MLRSALRCRSYTFSCLSPLPLRRLGRGLRGVAPTSIIWSSTSWRSGIHFLALLLVLIGSSPSFMLPPPAVSLHLLPEFNLQDAYRFLMEWPDAEQNMFVCYYRYVVAFLMYTTTEIGRAHV